MNGMPRRFARRFAPLRYLACGVALIVLCTDGGALAGQFYTFADIDTPCDLVLVDTGTGLTTVIGSTDAAPEGLAFGPDRVLYATIDIDAGCGLHGSADWLATIDPSTAAVSLVGPMMDDSGFPYDDVDSLAFAPDGTLYGVAVAGHFLITIDTATGAADLVAPLSPGAGIAFLGAIEFLRDGTLVGADMADASGGPTRLLRIDPASGTVSEIGDVGWLSVEGLALASDGRLYGTAGSLSLVPGTLIEIDPASGTGSFVQEIVPEPWRFLDGLASQRRLLVQIDIKPGSFPNCFNVDGHGVIPVAILGGRDFDVAMIDVDSLAFEGLDVRVRGPSGPLCSFADANGDAYTDLVCQFEDEDGAWSGGGSTASVTGARADGTWFEGFDSICMVP